MHKVETRWRTVSKMCFVYFSHPANDLYIRVLVTLDYEVNWETKIAKICYIEAKLNLNNTNIPIIVNNQSHIPNYLAQSSEKIGTKLFGLIGPSVGQTSSKMI